MPAAVMGRAEAVKMVRTYFAEVRDRLAAVEGQLAANAEASAAYADGIGDAVVNATGLVLKKYNLSELDGRTQDAQGLFTLVNESLQGVSERLERLSTTVASLDRVTADLSANAARPRRGYTVEHQDGTQTQVTANADGRGYTLTFADGSTSLVSEAEDPNEVAAAPLPCT